MTCLSRSIRLPLFLFLASLAGCAQLSGGVSPSTEPFGNRAFEELGSVRGTSSVIRLLGIIPLSGTNSTQAALKSALSKRPETDAMIEVTSDTSARFFILWTSQTITVEGTAVKFKRNQLGEAGGE